MSDILKTLYPGAPSEKPDTSVSATPVKNPYALNPESVEAKLYSATDLVEIDRDIDLNALARVTGEGVESLRTDIGFMAAAIGATQADMQGIINLATEYAIAPPDPASSDAVMRELYAHHGSETDKKLDDAIALAKSLPSAFMKKFTSAAGNDVRLIRQFIKFSETPRGQERLAALRGKKK